VTDATHPVMDKHDLYEWCVTDGPRFARFAEAVHGRGPRVLREDFSGSAALAKAWAAADPAHRSIAVDLDAAVLRRAAGPRVRAVRADAARCAVKADLIAATNFPLGYFHERPALVQYLAHTRRCLSPRGVFLADLYGGRDAMKPLTIRRRLKGPAGERIEYLWTQVEADPATNLVNDTLSFAVTTTTRTGTSRTRRFPDAFVYRWRLWSIPELRDALADAGFRRIELYTRMGDALDSEGNLYVRPHEAGEAMDENYVVYVAGRL
jgi:SAM-dependent methyltransferase